MVCITQCYYIRKELPIKEYGRKIIPFLIKSIVMFIIVIIVGKVINEQLLRLTI